MIANLFPRKSLGSWHTRNTVIPWVSRQTLEGVREGIGEEYTFGTCDWKKQATYRFSRIPTPSWFSCVSLLTICTRCAL